MLVHVDGKIHEPNCHYLTDAAHTELLSEFVNPQEYNFDFCPHCTLSE